MLASVAAMQGRIAMKHALGEAVSPLDLSVVSSNVFTDPEIATVGVTQRQIDSGEVVGCPGEAAAGDERSRQDAGVPRRIRQALLPPWHRHRDRAEWWSPRGPVS